MNTTDDQRLSRRQMLGAGAGVGLVAALAASPVRTAAATESGSGSDSGSDEPSHEHDPGLLPPERIGIQLYSVRDQINEIGFARVFEHLAATGYHEIEFAGYTQGSVGDISPSEIRSLMDANGLNGIASHVGLSVDNVEQELDTAEILGLPYIGVPTTSNSAMTTSDWQAEAERYNQIGQACADRGIDFYIHNHSTEFRPLLDDPTRRVYDILLEETDPELVFFQMDIYWAYVGQHQFGRPPAGGFEPLDYVTAQPERFPLFHVKDGARTDTSYEGYDMVDVGQGDIDFQNFFSTLGGGASHGYLMERDDAADHPHGSLTSALNSYFHMRYGIGRY